MLKQLELIGFKSFAERTIFEFGAGITAVVGPNGSGKSNVVDAVRWIMGEQSAKSLRGGGMTDVIFNGSATRKSLGLAEVSLTLDNSKRFFNVDADEVQITRRVYRDGTGEYLINKQMTRLKDIKEMFLGSGAGNDAYCIIAQGRVDALLQASSQERRFILEEAAGISRFRVKKLETLKKLEQVELNILRVKDIQDELTKQLQSVRLQASKAEKFRDYSNELKRLRVDLALQDWHQDSQLWNTASQELTGLKQQLEEQSRQSSLQEQQLAELEALLTQTEETIRRREASLSEWREKLTACDLTVKHEASTLETCEQSLSQFHEKEGNLLRQLERLQQQRETLSALYEKDAARQTELGDDVAKHEKDLDSLVKLLASLKQKMQEGKTILYEKLQTAARAHNEQVSLKSQLESLQQHRRRVNQKHSQTKESLSALDVDLQALLAAEKDGNSRIDALRNQLTLQRQNKEQAGLLLESQTAQWTSMRERRSALVSRIQVLEHLEQSREGIGSSVKQILDLASQENPGLWSNVLGIVADIILVDREHARLVDAILKDRIQAIVVREEASLLQALSELSEPLPGRWQYIALNRLQQQRTASPLHGVETLSSFAGSSQPDAAGLVEHLLSSTCVVDSLEQARQWSQHYPGYSWITPQAEYLDEQGIVSLGPDREETGFLSRKSELRELHQQVIELDSSIQEAEMEIASLRANLVRYSTQEEQTEQALQVQSEEAASLRARLQQKELQGKELQEEVRISQHELHTLEEELSRLTHSEKQAQDLAQQAEQAAQLLQQELQQAEEQASEMEVQRQKDQEHLMTVSLQAARLQQGLEALMEKIQLHEQESLRRQNELVELRNHHEELLNRKAASEKLITETKTQLETGQFEKQRLEHELAEAVEAGQQYRQKTASIREQTHQIRQAWQQLVDNIHSREMRCGELKLKLDGLSSRLLEEHEVNLQEAYQEYQPPETLLDSQEVQTQINELRRKISRLGNVSMDSLHELQSLEVRAKDLQVQLDDLTQAKASLDEIIQKINADSRKMFKETYEAVRVHFQELFRKLFGGGMADITLENPDDLLETGVEIAARPPGKEMRNMSLLSGGEKTLTAVALLLAIFKNKPSPFCIMDEVDAALDEANVGRFASVLREFLHLSQFILITHSKKTMASADVLYGVTMQEAGVSKRVAMRLEEYEEPAQRLAA
ncbi:MAG: chromosome segregation protein SMC [Planctomycetia bacterium]|nr:chromosome segregation protein SMC [Planctomycetia bacterium]